MLTKLCKTTRLQNLLVSLHSSWATYYQRLPSANFQLLLSEVGIALKREDVPSGEERGIVTF